MLLCLFVKTDKRAKTSLVPSPRPAFRHLQYGKAGTREKRYQALSRFSVLQATESWAGSENEAKLRPQHALILSRQSSKCHHRRCTCLVHHNSRGENFITTLTYQTRNGLGLSVIGHQISTGSDCQTAIHHPPHDVQGARRVPIVQFPPVSVIPAVGDPHIPWIKPLLVVTLK